LPGSEIICIFAQKELSICGESVLWLSFFAFKLISQCSVYANLLEGSHTKAFYVEFIKMLLHHFFITCITWVNTQMHRVKKFKFLVLNSLC